MSRVIQFLLTIDLEGYCFNPHRPDGLSFSDQEKGLEIEIRAGGQECDFDFGYKNLELRAKTSRQVTERQFYIIDALLTQRIVPPEECPVRLPYARGGEEVVAANGRIANGYTPTAEFLPKDLRDICASTGEALNQCAERFVQLLRWLESADGPVKFQRYRLYWGTSKDHYCHVPLPRQRPLTSAAPGGITWSDEYRQNFEQMWGAIGVQEPLGHQLLREAKGIADQNRRSALLICYSALEVGIKQHISNCAPTAAWLAMYSPTPPLFKILRDYLPKIHGENIDFKNWYKIGSELGIVKSYTEDRNRLAHRGENVGVSIDEYLRITHDLLTAFDVFEGQAWAKGHVSRRFRDLMGWKVRKGGLTVTVELLQ